MTKDFKNLVKKLRDGKDIVLVDWDKKVVYLDKSSKMKCYTCEGDGNIAIEVYTQDGTKYPNVVKRCPTCCGTGKWIEDNFYLITQTKNGEIIAFQTDCLGK